MAEFATMKTAGVSVVEVSDYAYGGYQGDFLSPPHAAREVGITEQTYYHWRKEFGGLKLDQAKRMKELEKESIWLKRLVREIHLVKQVLPDVAQGNFKVPIGGVVRWSMHGKNTDSPSGMPAGCYGSGKEHNAMMRCHAGIKTLSCGPSCPWRASMAVTAIGELPPCATPQT